MTHITRVKVALNLAKQSVLVKIAKGRHYVTSMTGNPSFPAPDPALAVVTTAVDALETAFDNADGGGTAETAIMHEKESIVDNLLAKLGSHVEVVANDDPDNAASIVLSAGMDLKKPAAPVGPVLRPENLRAGFFGDMPGTIKLKCKKSKGTIALIWEVIEGSPPSPGPGPLAAPPVSDWKPAFNPDFPKGVSTSSTFIVTGLSSGTTYTFRVFAVGAANQSEASDVIMKMAP